jgi:hypothetical protein
MARLTEFHHQQWFWPPWLGSFSQHDHLPFVTFVPACSTSCTAQTLSSTPLLALLVLPLDAFALGKFSPTIINEMLSKQDKLLMVLPRLVKKVIGK